MNTTFVVIAVAVAFAAGLFLSPEQLRPRRRAQATDNTDTQGQAEAAFQKADAKHQRTLNTAGYAAQRWAKKNGVLEEYLQDVTVTLPSYPGVNSFFVRFNKLNATLLVDRNYQAIAKPSGMHNLLKRQKEVATALPKASGWGHTTSSSNPNTRDPHRRQPVRVTPPQTPTRTPEPPPAHPPTKSL